MRAEQPIVLALARLGEGLPAVHQTGRRAWDDTRRVGTSLRSPQGEASGRVDACARCRDCACGCPACSKWLNDRSCSSSGRVASRWGHHCPTAFRDRPAAAHPSLHRVAVSGLAAGPPRPGSSLRTAASPDATGPPCLRGSVQWPGRHRVTKQDRQALILGHPMTLGDTWQRPAVELDDSFTLFLNPARCSTSRPRHTIRGSGRGRRPLYRSTRRLRELEARLPTPFLRCHDSLHRAIRMSGQTGAIVSAVAEKECGAIRRLVRTRRAGGYSYELAAPFEPAWPWKDYERVTRGEWVEILAKGPDQEAMQEAPERHP